jgi:hypothetical protein
MGEVGKVGLMLRRRGGLRVRGFSAAITGVAGGRRMTFRGSQGA